MPPCKLQRFKAVFNIPIQASYEARLPDNQPLGQSGNSIKHSTCITAYFEYHMWCSRLPELFLHGTKLFKNLSAYKEDFTATNIKNTSFDENTRGIALCKGALV